MLNLWRLVSLTTGLFLKRSRIGKNGTTDEVEGYGFYYMGSIICTGTAGASNNIVDGQQRLTSLTLLLIYLNNLQKDESQAAYEQVPIDNLIYSN